MLPDWKCPSIVPEAQILSYLEENDRTQVKGMEYGYLSRSTTFRHDLQITTIDK